MKRNWKMSKISGLDEKTFEMLCQSLFPSGGITKKDFTGEKIKDKPTDQNQQQERGEEKVHIDDNLNDKPADNVKKDKNTMKKEHKRQLKVDQKNMRKVSKKNELINALEKIKMQTRIEKDFSDKDQERIQQIIFNK